MLIHNVRIYNYLGGQQIRIYKKPVGRCADIWDDVESTKQKKDKDKKKGVKDEERSNVVSRNRTIQKVYEVTRSNMWEWFITLTFNPEKVNSFDYAEVSKILSKWLNHLKERYAPDLKYSIVPELHKSGRYHFHGLIADTGNMIFEDSGHKTFGGETIYNLGNYKLGFTTATKINDVSRASSYITKYITKDLCATTANKKRYWCSRNLNEVDITDYCMTREEIETMLDSLSDNIQYAKTIDVPILDQSVRILEVSEND